MPTAESFRCLQSGFFFSSVGSGRRRKMNSFISWIGGKKLLRDDILARLPPEYDKYIEVFGGAGWVLFRKPQDRKLEVYNDFNSNLVNLFRCVRDKPNKLKYKLRYVLNSREDFDWIATLHKKKLFPRFRDVDRAAKFFSAYPIQLCIGTGQFWLSAAFNVGGFSAD